MSKLPIIVLIIMLSVGIANADGTSRYLGECGGNLYLKKFEDGSALLKCNSRTMGRISVPW